MSRHYGWGPRTWRTLGWREFQSWRAAMAREVEARQAKTDSWEGRDSDPFWQEADRMRRERRGW